MNGFFRKNKLPVWTILWAVIAFIFVKLSFLNKVISKDERIIFTIFFLVVIYAWLWYNFIKEEDKINDPSKPIIDHSETCYERHLKFASKTLKIVSGIFAIIVGALSFFGYQQYSDYKQAKEEVLAIRDSVKADYLMVKELTSDDNFRKIEKLSKEIDSSKIFKANNLYNHINNEYYKLNRLETNFRNGLIQGSYQKKYEDDNIVKFTNMTFIDQDKKNMK